MPEAVGTTSTAVGGYVTDEPPEAVTVTDVIVGGAYEMGNGADVELSRVSTTETLVPSPGGVVHEMSYRVRSPGYTRCSISDTRLGGTTSPVVGSIMGQLAPPTDTYAV